MVFTSQQQVAPCTEELVAALQKVYYFLLQQKVKSVKHITTITELVVVWSVCSICTCTVNQRFLWPQLLMLRFTLLLQMLQRVKTAIRLVVEVLQDYMTLHEGKLYGGTSLGPS